MWHLDILPPAQRTFWEREARHVPAAFVLYGGTAVALRHGHRQSVDFDFFTDAPLDEADLRANLPSLASATVLHRAPDTLIVSADIDTEPVKLSFFGGLDFGRVDLPARDNDGPWVAGPLDLLATKLKVLQERVESKDYLDIAALLAGGTSLADGLGALLALYGKALNPMDAAKALAWFKDGDLERRLPDSIRATLTRAVADLGPGVPPVAIRSRRLAG